MGSVMRDTASERSEPSSQAIVPRNYHLTVYDLELAPTWRFSGSVVIEAEVQGPLDTITLHARDLEIRKAVVSQRTGELIPTAIDNIASNVIAGVVDLSIPHPLESGTVWIVIEYGGSIGDAMSGFSRAKYKENHPSGHGIYDGGYSYLLTTQFEPCFARSAFPCFDQPNLKATFDLCLEVPECLTALSNMPVKKCISLDSEKKGRKSVTFDRTPVMSTYLFAWAIGDLEYIESRTQLSHGTSHVPVRVYAPIGQIKYADFALDIACRVLDLYKDLFQIDYPIPKCDHLVVPEFVSGAMENWGLITYKPTKILFDPKTSNNRVKSKAAYVIAHELAHQWFGNLVTMDSWAELWLNEGFATWAGYLAVDHLYPEWNIWSLYVAEVMEDTLKLDSLPTTHAIETEITDENDALQMFDGISYFKASSVIRMLASHLGETTFLRGLASYLTTHAYSSARSLDLWDALGQASGVDVARLMDPWIHQPGFPVVHVTDNDDLIRLHLTSIFAPMTSRRACVWHIPLALDMAGAERFVLGTSSSMVVSRRNLGLMNCGHVGYCLVDYPSKLLHSVVKSVPDPPPIDLLGLVADMMTLTLNGLKLTSEVLSILLDLDMAQDPLLCSSVTRQLSFMIHTFSDETISAGLNELFKILWKRTSHQMQWLDRPDKTYQQAELDKSMIRLAVSAEAPQVLREARRRFESWKSSHDPSILGPNLRGVILASCLSTGSREDFEAVKEAYLRDTTIDGQEVYLTAMGAVTDPALVREVLDFAFATDDNVTLQHLHLLGGELGRSSVCRSLQWEYVKEHWPQVSRRLNANSTCRDWWLEASLSHFADLEIEQDIATFFAQHAGPEIAKPLAYVKANVRRNAAYKEGAKEDMLRFLQQGGYIS